MPLTGLPITDAKLAKRPAVVVKVGNYDAHPQRGTNQADLVFEEIINANISRFAVVFQSQTAPEVGPIRSGRRQDVNLFGSLNRPIFAWAGGNNTVTKEIQSSDLIDLSQFKCQGSCFRGGGEFMPYNLFFNVERVYALNLPDAGTPPQQFQYLQSGDTPAGRDSTGVDLKMDAYRVTWTWNPTTKIYERTQNGSPDRNRDGSQVTTNNVVVLEMVYNPGISGSPDAVSLGHGSVYVFTGGKVVHGTWTRPDRKHVFTLEDDKGDPIKLTPGRSFVELPRIGGNVTPK
ncbi:MAG: DUF3048 domain-containing protein [Actinomycetota bacterium]